METKYWFMCSFWASDGRNSFGFFTAPCSTGTSRPSFDSIKDWTKILEKETGQRGLVFIAATPIEPMEE